MEYMCALENGNADEKRYNYSCFPLKCFSTRGVTLETQPYCVFCAYGLSLIYIFPFVSPCTVIELFLVCAFGTVTAVKSQIQCTPNYPCMDFLTCRLSVHDNEVLMANDRGGK